MARLSNNGVTVEVPAGWEAEIDRGTGAWAEDPAEEAPAAASGPMSQPDGSVRRTVVHLANFPLPAGRGDFGGGAVELMSSGDVFVALFEHDPESATTPLFAAEGVPRSVEVGDFDPAALQRNLAGGTALQRFFHVADRAFCLYVVVGSHVDRRDAIASINAVLSSVEIR